MDARYHTSLTVQDCVHAISNIESHGTGPEVTSPYSAPLILMYKRRAAGSDVSISGLRSSKRTSQNGSRSKSALGMRLEYQDYLMSDYLNSKRALVSPQMQCEQSNLKETYPTLENGYTFKNGCDKRKPMFQNFLKGTGTSCSSGSSSPSDTPSMNIFDADDKRSPISRCEARTERQSKQVVRRGPNRSTSRIGDSTNHTTSRPHKQGSAFTFRYTKR